MKPITVALSVLALGLLMPIIGGCATDQPGVRATAGTYSTMLDASPDKVTTAATKALEQMKLADVSGAGTTVDGKVTARTAQNDLVAINIEKAGDNVSRMSVRVGATGDESVTRQILAKTRDNMHWFKTSGATSPEMKNVLGTYSSMFDAAPDKVTKATRKAVEEMKLTDIASTSTRIDGNVTARTAQNDAISIDITQAGENVSRVSIRVGAVGNEAASRQIMEKIKSNLHWL